MAKLFYDGKLVCEVVTNHSMSMEDMINLCFDDFEEEEQNGTPGFYYNDFTEKYEFDYEKAQMEW